MALFFDAAWFDARLRAASLSHDDVATALGLSRHQLAELWKDQRELKANDVRILAALIGARAEEVAERAGISTPVPKDAPADLAGLNARLDRIEAALAEIVALLRAMRA